MKNLFFITMIFFMSTMLNAQSWKGKGDQKVQLGLSSWGYGNGIAGTYDYGLNKLISVGAGINGYFENDNNNHIFVFGRLNFHLQEPLNLLSKWDIYSGVDVGVLQKDFGIGAHIGVRYFFTKKIGVFTEIGNNGSLGISFNL